MHENLTEEEEMKGQQRMKVMKDMTKKLDRGERWMPNNDGGLLNCWWQTARKRGSNQEWEKPCQNGTFGWGKCKKEDGQTTSQRLNQTVKMRKGMLGSCSRS